LPKREPVVPAEGLSPLATFIIAGATVALALALMLAWGYDHFFRDKNRAGEITPIASAEGNPGVDDAHIDAVKNRAVELTEKVDGYKKQLDETPAAPSTEDAIAPLRTRVEDVAKSAQEIPPLCQRVEGIGGRMEELEKSVKSVGTDLASIPPKSESTPKTESPETATVKNETPKAETPKVETVKNETPRTETPKAETVKNETPRTETPRTETVKNEAPKTETVKNDIPRTETPKTETPKTETPKTETPKTATPGRAVARETPKQDPAAASASHSISDAEKRDPAKPLLEDLDVHVDDAKMTQGIDLFKERKYKDAYSHFEKLEQSNPDDARVWYYAALSRGLALRDWKDDSDTARLVKKGVEREKAGTPPGPEIDAAFRDLVSETGKEWLEYYRKTVTSK